MAAAAVSVLTRESDLDNSDSTGTKFHIKKELERIFTRQNLKQDKEIWKIFNDDLTVPVEKLLAVPSLKALGVTSEAILEAAVDSPDLSVENDVLRPDLRAKRTTLIIRDFSSENNVVNDIQSILSTCPHIIAPDASSTAPTSEQTALPGQVVEIRPDINNTVFVKLSDEATTQAVALWLRQNPFKDRPFHVAVKSEQNMRFFFLQSTVPNGIQSNPHQPPSYRPYAPHYRFPVWEGPMPGAPWSALMDHGDGFKERPGDVVTPGHQDMKVSGKADEDVAGDRTLTSATDGDDMRPASTEGPSFSSSTANVDKPLIQGASQATGAVESGFGQAADASEESGNMLTSSIEGQAKTDMSAMGREGLSLECPSEYGWWYMPYPNMPNRYWPPAGTRRGKMGSAEGRGRRRPLGEEDYSVGGLYAPGSVGAVGGGDPYIGTYIKYYSPGKGIRGRKNNQASPKTFRGRRRSLDRTRNDASHPGGEDVEPRVAANGKMSPRGRGPGGDNGQAIHVNQENFPSLDDAVKMKPCGYTRAFRQYNVDQVRDVCYKLPLTELETSISDNIRQLKSNDLEILRREGVNLIWDNNGKPEGWNAYNASENYRGGRGQRRGAHYRGRGIGRGYQLANRFK